jgi:hypothetical protein
LEYWSIFGAKSQKRIKGLAETSAKPLILLEPAMGIEPAAC